MERAFASVIGGPELPRYHYFEQYGLWRFVCWFIRPVVNIGNGFGADYLASMINRMEAKR